MTLNHRYGCVDPGGTLDILPEMGVGFAIDEMTCWTGNLAMSD